GAAREEKQGAKSARLKEKKTRQSPQHSRLGWELNHFSILLTINCVTCQPAESHEPMNSSAKTLNLIGFVSPEILDVSAAMRMYMYMLLCAIIYRGVTPLLVSGDKTFK
ncbi:mCG145654, partial [Mus musculus]